MARVGIKPPGCVLLEVLVRVSERAQVRVRAHTRCASISRRKSARLILGSSKTTYSSSSSPTTNAPVGTSRMPVSWRAIDEPPRKLCMNIIERSSVQRNCECTVTSPAATYGDSARAVAFAGPPQLLSTITAWSAPSRKWYSMNRTRSAAVRDLTSDISTINGGPELLARCTAQPCTGLGGGHLSIHAKAGACMPLPLLSMSARYRSTSLTVWR